MHGNGFDALALLLAGCTGAPPAETHATDRAPVETDAPVPPEPPVPPPEAPVGPLPVEPAWPLGGGFARVPGPGVLVTDEAIVAAGEGTPCGTGLRVASQGDPIAWSTSGTPEDLPATPAVLAATVERASWRLADAIGPVEGILAGGRTDVDPAMHQGLQLRSVRKVRRSGAPALIAVGDRDGKAAIVVLDRDAREVLASDTFDLGPAPWPVIATSHVIDADADGRKEIVVYGDATGVDGAPGNGIRVVYHVDLDGDVKLERLGILRTIGESCPP